MLPAASRLLLLVSLLALVGHGQAERRNALHSGGALRADAEARSAEGLAPETARGEAARAETDRATAAGPPRRRPTVRRLLSKAALATGLAGVAHMRVGVHGAKSGPGVAEVFARLDANGDGRIDPSEFMGAARAVMAADADGEAATADDMDEEMWIEMLFSRADIDGDGFLSPQEVKVLEFLGRLGSSGPVRQTFEKMEKLEAAEKSEVDEDDEEDANVLAVARLISGLRNFFDGDADRRELMRVAQDIVIAGGPGEFGPRGLQRLNSLFEVVDKNKDGHLNNTEVDLMRVLVRGALNAVAVDKGEMDFQEFVDGYLEGGVDLGELWKPDVASGELFESYKARSA